MNRRYRKTVIAGNWKMNMTATETKKFAEELKKIMVSVAVMYFRYIWNVPAGSWVSPDAF